MTALADARRDMLAGGAVAALLSLGVTAGVLVVPLYDMHLFDRILAGRNVDTLVVLSVFCVIGVGFHAALSAIRGVLLAALAERVARRLSAPSLAAGLRRAVGGDGAAAVRALADLQELRLFFSGGAASAPLDLLLAPVMLAALFLLHPALGWLGLGAALSLLAWAVATDALARPALSAAQARMDRALGEASGLLRDPVLLDGLGMGPGIAARWQARQAAGLAALAAAGRVGETLGAGARLSRALLQGAAVSVATLLVLRHEATPQVLVGANLLLALLLAPLDQMLTNWRATLGARLAWQRLGHLLGEGSAEPRPVAAEAPGIVLRDIALSPPGAERPVLDGVSLSVAPGEIVLLAGPNGAGKSSLVRIAAGVLRPDSGLACVDGEAASAAAEGGRIGYLPQRPQLLEGSVAETIARFRDAPAEAIVAAARAAGLHGAIGRLPQGYATPIGPLEPLLSGGQRQRLALARALFGDPPVLILDEPDASLDHEGEGVLAEALAAARARGAAVLVVSHRSRLRALADRVITLEGGRLDAAARQAEAA